MAVFEKSGYSGTGKLKTQDLTMLLSPKFSHLVISEEGFLNSPNQKKKKSFLETGLLVFFQIVSSEK